MLSSANICPSEAGFSDGELYRILDEAIAPDLDRLKRVLLLPPDFTRYHSMAGKITAHLYQALIARGCRVDIMPALGSHAPVTRDECEDMYLGQVPYEALIRHDWRGDVVKLGQVDAQFVSEISEGLLSEPIDVEINRRVMDSAYDLVLSIGQVVPHEVAGMANRGKNLFVGCGGASMINHTHMLGAVYGMERVMGRDFSPVRRVFDYAEERFLSGVPLNYILTVTTQRSGRICLNGLFIGRERSYFEQAVALSQQKNLTVVDAPFKKIVVYLDEREFKATWVGNKAIYRTALAIADGGELVVLAGGVSMYCEDAQNDRLIAKYGYCGREKVLALSRTCDDLKASLSVAAHLIHGSSNGRFKITYCTRALDEAAVRRIGYDYMPYDQAIARYNPGRLREGVNRLEDGEEIFYVSNPALGLWVARERMP